MKYFIIILVLVTSTFSLSNKDIGTINDIHARHDKEIVAVDSLVRVQAEQIEILTVELEKLKVKFKDAEEKETTYIDTNR